MAEEQVTVAPEASQDVTEELKIDSKLALNRYIYIREVNSFLVNNDDQSNTKLKLWSLTSYNIDKHIKKLTETEPMSPLNLIKKVSS